ncbi:MAG: DCC1-like thiol-disulfide oxidoreductase family protein [Alphaproteobacteria bacterium]|nr:DCC1-like thiol-disulfide oxidoreductase family protein [Alphaproteobacteria bacterium]
MNEPTSTLRNAPSGDGPNQDTLALVYDGDCPVCSAYCRVIALRQLNTEFEIINARSDHSLVTYLHHQSFDLDEGMVMIVGENIYYGADAIRVLSSLTSAQSFANRINHFIFKSRTISTLLYPFLKLGRRALLILLGRKTIAETRLSQEETT